jgi:Siphovirus ReqiPepy6 Gp37-like protein
MDIYVYDKSFNALGIIDRFTSLIWKRKYYKSGSFELHLFLPQASKDALYLIGLLQKGNILMKEDSPEEAGYIEDIILDDAGSETIVVKGYFVDNLIKERFVWMMHSYSGTIEEVMKNFVSNNCILPENPNRVVPNLVLSNARGVTKQANEVNSFGSLNELMEELAVKYDVGWRVLFDLVNKKYVFDVFEGKDSSVNQTKNPHTIFSIDYENVLNQTYSDSYSNYRNMALIGGQGEGAERKFAIINDELTGFERRELFVDAKDIVQEKEDGSPLTDQEYEAILIERGKSKLSELTPIQTFKSGISVLSNLIYKQDFDLGDKVTIQNNRWGITINTRITSIDEVYENNKVDIRVNFGNNIPNLIDKIKQRMR